MMILHIQRGSRKGFIFERDGFEDDPDDDPKGKGPETGTGARGERGTEDEDPVSSSLCLRLDAERSAEVLGWINLDFAIVCMCDWGLLREGRYEGNE